MKTMEGVVVENGGEVLAPRAWANNNKENYLEQMRGSLMVVATVIASLTFQIAINPPGGVWQSNTKPEDGCAIDICKVGTSVLAFGNTTGSSNQPLFFYRNLNNFAQKHSYEGFILLCTISFSVSQAIIVFLIFGFPLRNKFFRWLLIIATCVSVLCTGGAYAISMLMILNPLNGVICHIIFYYAISWAALILLLVISFVCRFVYWLLKPLFRFIRSCSKRVYHELG